MKILLWCLALGACATLTVWVPAPRAAAACSGAALALAGVVFGVVRRSPSGNVPETLDRFFLERRRSPRHAVEIPVRLGANGTSHVATLVSISASGALLRLPAAVPKLQASTGELVSLGDYPTGRLVRVGPAGLYIEFAVAFEARKA